ncbi:terpene synthase family protein [Streptomyces sp. NPDC001928]|uniref:terpene synthase family protein n=1 Tax=Streptomyces sp. NPDC001928 TaxID=3154404 RepID=UPI00333211EE
MESLDVWPQPEHPLWALESAIAPWRIELEAQILRWADDYDLLDDGVARRRLADTNLGELIARSYPAIHHRNIEAVAGWFTWAFVIDDCYESLVGRPADEYDELTARTLRVLTPDASILPQTDSRLDALLAQVWNQLAVSRSEPWRIRFTLHMMHFLSAFKYEALNRRHRHMPGVLPYTQLRRASGGITTSLDLLEVAHSSEVPPLLHETEQLGAMFNRASDFVVWVNDIISLRKEVAAGETTNGVLILAKERNFTLQKAIDSV